MQRNPDINWGRAGWYKDQKFNAFVCRAGQFHLNQKVWRAMKILRKGSRMWFDLHFIVKGRLEMICIQDQKAGYKQLAP